MSRAGWAYMLAGEPESGCTLTPHLEGSALKAASARFLGQGQGQGQG